MKNDTEMMDFLFANLPKPEFVFAAWIFILLGVVIDLMTGVYKAKSFGYMITSDGLKRSISKMVLYYALMSFFSMIDIMAYGLEVVSVPYFSLGGCLFILFVEGKSVFERANEKERKRLMKGAKDVTAILASKDEIAKAIHDYIESKEKDKNG